jgi:hypothetical protein
MPRALLGLFTAQHGTVSEIGIGGRMTERRSNYAVVNTALRVERRYG